MVSKFIKLLNPQSVLKKKNKVYKWTQEIELHIIMISANNLILSINIPTPFKAKGKKTSIPSEDYLKSSVDIALY